MVDAELGPAPLVRRPRSMVKRIKLAARYTWPVAHWHRRAKRLAIRRAGSELVAVRRLPPASAHAIIVVACMRDESIRLPDFLRHYRELGVDRFILIDNLSRDGSRELALAEPDVELYTAHGSYAGSAFGTDWVMWCIQSTGLGRWYLVADIDELLVYDRCGEFDLMRLAERLEKKGSTALPALMLDMYGDQPLETTHLAAGGRLIDTCPLFDGFYRRDETALRDPCARRKCVDYLGGPRARVFSLPGRPFYGLLAKTPLMRWGSETLYPNAHLAYPYEQNFLADRGCLLHFKFLSDFHDRAVAAVSHGEHWLGSKEYRHYLEVLKLRPNLSLAFEGSLRYRGPESLVAAGLMPAMDWKQ